MAAAQDVHVQMRNGFARVGPIVHNQPIPGLRQAEFPGHLGCLQHEMPKHRLILSSRLGDSGNRFLRNNQHVNRRSGLNVAERDYQVVLVNNLRGNLARDDFFEQRHTNAFYRTTKPREGEPPSTLRHSRR